MNPTKTAAKTSCAVQKPTPNTNSLSHRAKMAPNPATIPVKSLSSFCSIPLPPKPISPFLNPSRISANFHPESRFPGRFSCRFGLSSNSSHEIRSGDLGPSKMRFGKMGLDFFPARAVSDGGFGGEGGFGGSSGGGGGDSDGRGEEESGGNDHSLLSWYLVALEKYPVLTKALTSALLTFIGDSICQLLIDRVPTLDLKRTFLFTFLGFVLVGPTLHFWYFYLSNVVTMPGGTGAFLRLLLDQFLFSPIFIGVFLSCLLTLEGRPSQIMPKLRQEWFSSVVANWQLWIPFQFLNFRFVPQQFQVLAANVVALVWNVILSFKAHKEVISK